jgi:tight adherence protein B
VGLTLLIFLTAVLGITAGYHLLADLLFPEATRVRRRVAQEFGKGHGQVAASALFKNLDKIGADFSKTEQAEQPAAPTLVSKFRSSWNSTLEQADLKLSAQTLCQVALCLALAAGVTAIWLGGLIVGAAAALTAVPAPFVFVRWKAKVRRTKFLSQLPAAFELMARIVRAGQSIPQALRAVADSFQDPIATEFAKCQNQLNLGLAPEVAFREMAKRSGILEVQIFVMAVLIQRQAGGSLSEVLDRLAGLVRARLRLRKQIRSLTAEGRLQGWTLAVLPFIVFGAMMAINRDYAITLLDHTRLLAITGTVMVVGMIWIRRIVNIEI